MADGHRSFAPTCMMCLVLTLMVPVWLQVIRYNLVTIESIEVQSTVVAAITSLGVFYILGLLLSATILSDMKTGTALNLLTYALTPVNLALWIVFAFNYKYSGRLTVVTYILTGAGNVRDVFFGQLQTAGAILFAWVLFVAYCCAKNGSDDSGGQSLLFTLLLAPAMVVSLGIGAFVGDVIRPGFLNTILRLFNLIP
jgi:hypothetical protein